MKKSSDKPMLMGILNVTPDSFSDGGEYNRPSAAVERAFTIQQQGADIIDIGGESTRPGADEIAADEQIARVIPVIQGIRARDKHLLISVDTTNNQVADAALAAGANWINDISAGEDSAEILHLAAKHRAPIVLMHRQGKSKTMQDAPHYDDVCQEVCDYLNERAMLAQSLGVDKSNIILDPGIGFGKTTEHNLLLLQNLATVVRLGYPVMLGTSRKRFLGEIIDEPTPNKRAIATSATTALGVAAGASIFRVHDIVENKQALAIAVAIKNAK